MSQWQWWPIYTRYGDLKAERPNEYCLGRSSGRIRWHSFAVWINKDDDSLWYHKPFYALKRRQNCSDKPLLSAFS